MSGADIAADVIIVVLLPISFAMAWGGWKLNAIAWRERKKRRRATESRIERPPDDAAP